MLNAHESIVEALRVRAIKESRPFCYSCYVAVSEVGENNTHCPKCGSDDNMRELPGVGCEYGTDWIVEHFVKDEFEYLTESEMEDRYIELLDEIYDEVKIGNLTVSAGDVMKTMDPIAFRIGVSEEADHNVEEGRLVELNGDYYEVPFDLQP